MICQSKTKKGKKCMRKCKGKYCYLHKKKGGQNKLNAKASAFIPTKKPKKTKLNKKAKEFIPIPKRKTPTPEHLLKPGELIIQKRTAKYCPDYQEVCKKSKYGDVYKAKCSLENRREDNVGLRNQAAKCVKLRIYHAKCRAEKGLSTTPKHEYAIRKIYKNLETCKKITDMQKQMILYQRLKTKAARKIKSEPSKKKIYANRSKTYRKK